MVPDVLYLGIGVPEDQFMTKLEEVMRRGLGREGGGGRGGGGGGGGEKKG